MVRLIDSTSNWNGEVTKVVKWIEIVEIWQIWQIMTSSPIICGRKIISILFSDNIDRVYCSVAVEVIMVKEGARQHPPVVGKRRENKKNVTIRI